MIGKKSAFSFAPNPLNPFRTTKHYSSSANFAFSALNCGDCPSLFNAEIAEIAENAICRIDDRQEIGILIRS
jgi:hypothetical protein